MELKCKQSLINFVETESNTVKLIDSDDDGLSNLEDDYTVNDDYDVPFITYRDVGMQTESPFMVDKAIQVSLPRSRRKPTVTRRSPNYIDGVSSKNLVTVNNNNNNNSHGLMPNILYNNIGNKVNYYESPQFRSSSSLQSGVDLMEEAEDDDQTIYQLKNEIIKELKVTKRKNKSPIGVTVKNKIIKQQLEDESYQDNDSTDLRLGLISENDDDPMDMLDQPLIINSGGQQGETVNDIGLEVDDMYIFTHHPTGLCYQIFNGNRSINKEMMEKVFSSVIGKEDKFYVCLYPPHAGTCHSAAGKSTKIRAIKNHLTSHLFLYRCRLCGRTYKYYNNLFNHFNKHPQI